MKTGDAIKLAAAVVGTAITGKVPIQVSRKILPMRAPYAQAEGLKFTTRLVYDDQGRCVEEVRVLAGRIPDGAPRYFINAQIEISQGDRKVAKQISNPIPASSLQEAFDKHDAIFHECVQKFQEINDAAEKAACTEQPSTVAPNALSDAAPVAENPQK